MLCDWHNELVMPKGRTECYGNENTKVSTIEIITTTLHTPIYEQFERKTQDKDHGLEVEWTMNGLYSLQQRACLAVVVQGITYEQSW